MDKMAVLVELRDNSVDYIDRLENARDIVIERRVNMQGMIRLTNNYHLAHDMLVNQGIGKLEGTVIKLDGVSPRRYREAFLLEVQRRIDETKESLEYTLKLIAEEGVC